MADFTLLLEAEKRGILPAEKAVLLGEARKRGLIPSASPSVSSTPGISLGEADAGLMSEMAPARGLIPAMGMVGGGALGSLINPGAGSYYGGVGGAGAGSLLEDYLYGKVGDATTGGEKAINAVSSMIGAGIGGGAMAPKPVPPEWQTLAVAAKDRGLPLSLQAITGGQRGNVLEGAANLTLAGKFRAESSLAKTQDMLMGVRGKILEEIAEVPGVTAGKRMVELGAMKKEVMHPKTKGAYQLLQDELAGEVVEVPKLEAAIEKGLKKIPVNPQNEKAIGHLQAVLADIRAKGGAIDGGDLYDFQSMVTRTYGKKFQGTVVDPIVDSISADLTAFSVARKFTEDTGKIYLNARNIARNEHGFDTVYRILNKSSKLDPATSKEVFYVGTLESELNRSKPAIFKAFGAEKGGKIIRQMEDIAELFKAASRDQQFLAGKTDTGKSIRKTWDIAQGLGMAGGAVPQGRGAAGTVMLANGTGLAITAALTNPRVNKTLIDLMKVLSKGKAGLGSIPPALRGVVAVGAMPRFGGE